MKKIIITLMFAVLFLSMGSAEIQVLGTLKQSTNIELIQTCANCTSNNITSILYPNSTPVIQDVQMTKRGSEFNYTLLSSYTFPLGRYIVNGIGDPEGVKTIWDYVFYVTPEGVEQESILNNPTPIFLVFLAFVLLILGIYFTNPSLGFIGSIILILSGMYTLIYGFNNVTNLYTQGAGISLIGLAIIFLFASAYEWFSFGEWGGSEEE